MAPEVERILQRILDLIEDNLCAELTAAELSREAGFSVYHFYRLFEAAPGMSVKRYILRRRLMHAVYEISLGMDRTSAAFRYGFDTYSGFYRAFRRESGMSPTSFLKTHRVSRPARISLKEEVPAMDEKQIRKALAFWEMEEENICGVYYHNTGNRSENTFLIGKRYYLKASASFGELQRQARLQRLLSRHQLAAGLVADREGNDVVNAAGIDFLLMEKVEGKPAEAVQMIQNPESAQAIGKGLARLHMVLKTCDPLLCREENLISVLQDWAIPAAKSIMGADVPELKLLLETYDDLPKQIVHRDPNPDNMLLDNGEVVCFLDFQLSRIMPRIFDLAYAATGILSNTFDRLRHPDDFVHMCHELWRGYHSLNPLTAQETAALPDMVIAVQLICVAAFAGTQKYAELGEINQKMLRMILKNEAKLCSFAS